MAAAERDKVTAKAIDPLAGPLQESNGIKPAAQTDTTSSGVADTAKAAVDLRGTAAERMQEDSNEELDAVGSLPQVVRQPRSHDSDNWLTTSTGALQHCSLPDTAENLTLACLCHVSLLSPTKRAFALQGTCSCSCTCDRHANACAWPPAGKPVPPVFRGRLATRIWCDIPKQAKQQGQLPRGLSCAPVCCRYACCNNHATSILP